MAAVPRVGLHYVATAESIGVGWLMIDIPSAPTDVVLSVLDDPSRLTRT
jgi:hypothetical protein